MKFPEHVDKSLNWLMLVTLVGLLPLICVSGYVFIIEGKFISHGKVLADGMILFFSTALVGSLAIDYRFSEQRISSYFISDLLFLIFPILIILTCIITFSYCFLTLGGCSQEDHIDVISRLIWAEVISFVMTLVYAFFVKAWFFKCQARRDI
ncbi:MAG: hypothetical protein R3E08_13955 [Thiotrichaceae bacterium]